MVRIAILISGRGSNMVAIVDAVKSGEIPDADVALVISDKADVAGLEKARERGVEALVIERRGRMREEHDAEIVAELKKREVDLVCLAGYMRLLSPSFVTAFPNRIVNIHPSLLPDFPGLGAQKQAFDAKVKITGCTVHFVDEHLDHGPIILQQWVPLENGDSVESLSERILEVEHRLYVEAVSYLVAEISSFRDKSFRPKYKVLKALAHNFTHSYSSWNWKEIQEIKALVRNAEGQRVSIKWYPPTTTDPRLSGKVRNSVQRHATNMIRDVHNLGAVLWSIKEFRSEFYLLPNHQMVLEGVIVDDRGNSHSGKVYQF